MVYLKDLPQFLPPVTVFNGVARVDYSPNRLNSHGHFNHPNF